MAIGDILVLNLSKFLEEVDSGMVVIKGGVWYVICNAGLWT